MKDKSGKDITMTEFFQRWKEGIKNVTTNPTPLEKVSIEINSTFVTLAGLITCFIVLIIFRDKFFVSWFSYGMMLIFFGNIISTGMKFINLKNQKKFLIKLRDSFIEIEYKEDKKK